MAEEELLNVTGSLIQPGAEMLSLFLSFLLVRKMLLLCWYFTS